MEPPVIPLVKPGAGSAKERHPVLDTGQESRPPNSVRPERSKAKSKDWMPDHVRHDEGGSM